MANYFQESAPAADDGGLWIKTSTGEIFFGAGGGWTNTSAVVDFASFANQSTLNDTDTFLARTFAGAGVEVPGSSIIKKNSGGQVVIGAGSPAELFDVKGRASFGSQKTIISYSDSAYSGFRNGATLVAEESIYMGLGEIFFAAAAANRWKITADAFVPVTDNVSTVGTAALRAEKVFSAGGVETTSDATHKKWLRYGLTDDEYRAGLKIREKFGWYQMLDDIARKGEEKARHFYGVKVQEVWDIFSDHGLEPKRREDGGQEFSQRGMISHSVWEDITRPLFVEKEVKVKVDVPNPKFNPDKKEGPRNKRMISETETRQDIVDSGKVEIVRKADGIYMLKLDMLNAFMGSVRDRYVEEELQSRDERLNALEERLA